MPLPFPPFFPSCTQGHSPAMGTLLPKRPCCCGGGGGDANFSSSFPSRPYAAANMSATAAGHSDSVDRLLEVFLGIVSNSSLAVELAVERLVDSWVGESEKGRVIESAMRLGAALTEAAKRSERQLATKHNSASWSLPADLTIKVFSMLDTQSVCHAAATCSMFNKCANDPMCYASVDLTSVVPKISNAVVYTMVQRAGKNLRSLKLGIWPSPNVALSTEPPRPTYYSIRNPVDAPVLSSWNEKRPRQGKESSVLTRSCLLCLSMDGGAAGLLLRRLHLYNIDKMDCAALCTALSACHSLVDLEVVGIHIELRQTLESVYTNCHLIERLFLESSITGRDESLKSTTCLDLVHSCPCLTSLALRGFKLHDHKARILLKGIRKLKLLDFSTSYSITGTFLRNLGGSGPVLEVLVLRDCLHLKEVEVVHFLLALLAGDFKQLKTLDISNKDGLSAEEDWYRRCYDTSNLPIARVMQERPDVCLVVDFPTDGRHADVDQMIDSDINSDDISIPSQEISFLSSDSFLLSSSESSYNSDPGSGNDDFPENSIVAFVEGPDEVDFLPW